MAKQTFKAPQRQQSNEEEKFIWWLDEMKDAGYIIRYELEPETFEVLPPWVAKKEKHYKSRPNLHQEFNLLDKVLYTYDVKIVWSHTAEYLFYEIYSDDTPFVFGKPHFIAHYIADGGQTEIVSYVDVKPHRAAAEFGGKVSSFYTFPFVQKFIMFRYNLYINKAVPLNSGKHGLTTCLFAVTFTPNRFKFTDSGQQMRKIRFNTRTLAQYVQLAEKKIKEYNDTEAKKVSKSNQQSLL